MRYESKVNQAISLIFLFAAFTSTATSTIMRVNHSFSLLDSRELTPFGCHGLDGACPPGSGGN